MDKYLLPLLNGCESLPFLFIGSGLTRRYYNLPDWMGLLSHLANKIYNDEFKFAKLVREARDMHDKDLEYNKFMTHISDQLSKDLNEIWYSSDDFLESRLKYKDLVLNKSVSPFKIEIAKFIEDNSTMDKIYEKEINSMSSLSNKSISGIITTNYDNFLESIFDYEVYSSQDSLLFRNNYEVGEIYKIHGCISEPETIMITSKDYGIIEDKNKYIAAKLLTIFIEHPIFFIGYSLGDEDIKKILFDIVKCLSTEQLLMIEKRLFFISWDSEERNFRSESYTLEFENRQVITMTRIFISDYRKLYDSLSKNKSKYPIKILRTMKKDMYNMVLTNDPKNRMMITMGGDDIDEERMDKIQFLYGFGVVELARKGYGQPKASEIFYDTVLNNKAYDSDSLLTLTIPQIEKFYGLSPIYKYLDNAHSKIREGYVKEGRYSKTYNSFLNEGLIRSYSKYSSISEITNMKFSISKETREIEKLKEIHVNIDELEEYLCDLLRKYPNALEDKEGDFSKGGTKTSLRRLIRIYDWLKYGKSKSTL